MLSLCPARRRRIAENAENWSSIRVVTKERRVRIDIDVQGIPLRRGVHRGALYKSKLRPETG